MFSNVNHCIFSSSFCFVFMNNNNFVIIISRSLCEMLFLSVFCLKVN
jgi:hypothetical protein